MNYTNNFFNCLNCRNELERRVRQRGFLYRCRACRSYGVSVPLLRATLPLALVNQLWQDARNATSRTGRPCPLCQVAMVSRASHQGQVLEICSSCRLIWFDPGDYPGDAADLELQFQGGQLSPRAREAIAIAQVESLRRRGEREEREVNFVHGIIREIIRLPWG